MKRALLLAALLVLAAPAPGRPDGDPAPAGTPVAPDAGAGLPGGPGPGSLDVSGLIPSLGFS